MGEGVQRRCLLDEAPGQAGWQRPPGKQPAWPAVSLPVACLGRRSEEAKACAARLQETPVRFPCTGVKALNIVSHSPRV